MRLSKQQLMIGILMSTAIALACSEDGENQREGLDGGNSDTDADSDTDTDTDTDADADVVTTLDGAAVLSALSEAEATQLCDDIWVYFARTISNELFCKWKGLSYATSSSAPSEEQLRANCTSTETTCLTDPTAAWAGNSGCSAPPADCAATVADYSTCIRDIAAGFIQAVSGMSTCDAFTTDLAQAVWALKGADRLPSCMLTNCTTLWPPDPKDI